MSKKIMSEKDYYYWEGRFANYDDLPDGAWWAACQSAIGGYDKMMAWLEAGRVYDKRCKV